MIGSASVAPVIPAVPVFFDGRGVDQKSGYMFASLGMVRLRLWDR